MDIEKNETLAAEALKLYAEDLIKAYVTHPGDAEAATVAVLARAIECVTKREVNLC